MPADEAPTTLRIALLGELASAFDETERIHAVLAWTDRGQRYYQSLTAVTGRDSGASRTAAVPTDLASRISSSGHGWRTRLLESIPAELRHLPPEGAVHALASRLVG